MKNETRVSLRNLNVFKGMHMRQCEIKDIKLSQARTKTIALGWYCVTMIGLCQTNPDIHCSQGMHIVQINVTKLKYYFINKWKRLENYP